MITVLVIIACILTAVTLGLVIRTVDVERQIDALTDEVNAHHRAIVTGRHLPPPAYEEKGIDCGD